MPHHIKYENTRISDKETLIITGGVGGLGVALLIILSLLGNAPSEINDADDGDRAAVKSEQISPNYKPKAVINGGGYKVQVISFRAESDAEKFISKHKNYHFNIDRRGRMYSVFSDSMSKKEAINMKSNILRKLHLKAIVLKI